MRKSEEAAFRYSKNEAELKAAIKMINKKIQKYQKEEIYNIDERECFEYLYSLSLQREAQRKLRKSIKPHF
ncbi:MAG: hypothetical protein J5970_04400 [Bacilli bacterium]|nr:hypothetical protein [Bacilli bacterium]